MFNLKKLLVMLLTASTFIVSNASYAHSMVAQQGTLNFVDGNIYLLFSLPISAFTETSSTPDKAQNSMDDNNDGQISMIEFNRHRKAITNKIDKSIYVSAGNDNVMIEGLLLSPTVAHDAQNDNIDQVIIMGRYSLPNNASDVSFIVELFSPMKALQTYTITATNKQKNLKRKFKLMPTSSSTQVFDKRG